MLNQFARFLLVSTSLSPILGAIAINKIALGRSWREWILWIIAAVLLVVLCRVLLWYASCNAQRHTFHVSQFDKTDQEVLAFLLAYLLPFISSENMAFEEQWLTGVYIVGVIFIVVSHSGSLHFNPVMGMLGYHFYSVRNDNGPSQLLISMKELREPGIDLTTVRIARSIHLHV